LGKALIDILPVIGVYILSFLLVGMYWVFHHHGLTFITHVDGFLLWLNILFLLFVSFLPFPTMLMGRYPFHTLPVVIYGCNLLLANGTGLSLMLYLKRNKQLASPALTEEAYKSQLRIYFFVNVSYIISILLAFIFPAVSFFVFAFIAVGLIIRSVFLSRTVKGCLL
jgi:uncharacterized membrane protein